MSSRLGFPSRGMGLVTGAGLAARHLAAELGLAHPCMQWAGTGCDRFYWRPAESWSSSAAAPCALASDVRTAEQAVAHPPVAHARLALCFAYGVPFSRPTLKCCLYTFWRRAARL